jgi:hypothetical protein
MNIVAVRSLLEIMMIFNCLHAMTLCISFNSTRAATPEVYFRLTSSFAALVELNEMNIMFNAA